MRIQQIGIQAKAKTIAKQILHSQSVTTESQVGNILDPVPQIQVENQHTSAHFMNDDIQKALEIINQMKNYSSSSLKDLIFQQKITLTSDNSSVQDIQLVKLGKQGMKRSMKKNLKKSTMQKIIMPNLIQIGQVFMDLLLFQHDYIEKKMMDASAIDNMLTQADSIFLQQQAVENELIKRQKQRQEIMIKIQKTIEHLSKSHSSSATKELSNAVRFTLGKNQFMLCQRQKEQKEEKCLKKANFFEKQFALQVNQFVFSKQKFQDKQDLNQSLILEDGHVSSKRNSIDMNSINQGQQHDCCQNIIEKVSEQAISLRQKIRSYQYSNSQEGQKENNQNIKQNYIPQTLKEEAQYQNKLLSDQIGQCLKTEQRYQLLADYFESSAEFIYHTISGQQKELLKDHVNIEHLLQQLNCSNNLKLTAIKLQFADQQISIGLTQAQRNILLNLIKQKKKSQIRRLITTAIFKQQYLLKQGTVVQNKLLTQNIKPKFKENNQNQIEENHLGYTFYSQQTQQKIQIQRLKQQISVYDANCKILNGHKLLGGGCGSSKIIIDNPQSLKKVEQSKLLKDEVFKESQYIDESRFSNFIAIYEKYYTHIETQPTLLEQLIRDIVIALHGQCINIVLLEIRHKVIELINLLINYYMIVIQNDEIRSLQKFIDDTDQKLKDLKEACFQNRKKYPCLDLYQYFDFLICLNQQRQGIDQINKSKAFQIAEVILKIVKFGAGFTSIFGIVHSLSTINPQAIQQDFKKIKQLCVNLFEVSQQSSEQALNYYTSYSSGTLFNNIQAIWLRKIDSLGLGDEQQEIIFYLQQREEVENKGNNEIILFVYMQLNHLLQKKQKEDNLNSLSKLLKNSKQENLIIDFIKHLQFKTYTTTLFEAAKKLLNRMVTSEQFRYLKISLLLKFSQILEQFNDKKQYHELMIYLCMIFLQENEISVKMVLKGSQKIKFFFDNIEKYTVEIVNESKQSYQIMKTMIESEQQLNKTVNKIESKEDIALLLAKSYIQMWEVSVKQRQESNQISHKDDVLLEVIQLYIKQRVSYLGGYSFFKDFDNENQEKGTEFNDALKLIIDKFLIPNFVQPRTKQLELNQNLILDIPFPKRSFNHAINVIKYHFKQTIKQANQSNQRQKLNQSSLNWYFRISSRTHVLNLLLQRGYKVRGTVRSLQNPKKVDHLYKINPNKRTNLELVEADLSNKDSWDTVMKGIYYVVHTASPNPQTVPKNEDDLIIPAVLGTEAIFQAALKHGVKKIVMTSSIVSVFTGNAHKNFFTSSDWSNLTQSPPYEKSKTLAEKKAWEIYEKNKSQIKMTMILPGYIHGPSFHSNDCLSTDFIQKVMKNELPGIPKISFATIDIRDCALAHVIPLDQEKLELTNGKRYLLTEGTYWMYDLIQILKEEFSQQKYQFPSFTIESKALLSLAGCMDKQAEMIKPLFQRRILYDNTPKMDDMNIHFRHHISTILEFAYDLINKGLIPNKLPKEAQISPEIIKS
ncbi:hypothetical protein ABPG72_019837 [Tetrahymena utriculariae]